MNLTPELLARLESLLDRAELLLPETPVEPDWSVHRAARWRKRAGRGFLQPVAQPHALRLEDLQCIERAKTELDRNIRQFVAGRPANHALLWGSRGTGKSSLVKALLNAYHGRGLRLIEVEAGDLVDLPDIVERIDGRPERFLIFCDDLSFEADDARYKALKAVLDGSVAAPPENVLIVATSNRRHLLPEYHHENRTYKHTDDGELHPGEAVEEKISLSERFGLWISFYPFSQDEYLAIVAQWLRHFSLSADVIAAARPQALVWALERGSRSGRVAYQFARDFVGRAEGQP